MPRFAAVELGGTSVRVAIAENECTNIVARQTFPCGAPEETLASVKAWLGGHFFDALGVASFGPIEVRRSQPKYGFITTTPKSGWADVDVLGGIGARELKVPVAFDTDVNAPAVSEYRAAAAREPGLTSCAYITVGTGVGVGLVVNSLPVHGMLHPEAGHCPVPNAPGDSWECPLDLRIPCGVEARVSAPALASRAGVSQSELAHVPDSDPMWDYTAHYLACLCVDLVLIASVERIVLGGGVMGRACLLPKVRARFLELLNGYVRLEQLQPGHVDEYIVPPAHGNDAGLIGALTIAHDALASSREEATRKGPTLALGAAALVGIVGAALLVGMRLGRRA